MIHEIGTLYGKPVYTDHPELGKFIQGLVEENAGLKRELDELRLKLFELETP